MVGYAYELGTRQSARVLEQSARAHATVWAEIIDQSQPRAISGQIAHVNPEVLVLDVCSDRTDLCDMLPGQYFQLVINLGENRYMTVCDLLEVQPGEEGPRMILTRPQNLQIMQRRRFARRAPDKSYPVYISWEDRHDGVNTPVLGQICDLSVHGMSIRLPGKVDNLVFIGDTIYARFTLGVRDPEYFTEAVVCHKDVGPDKSNLLIGVQFIDSGEDDTFQSRLQSALMQDSRLEKGK